MTGKAIFVAAIAAAGLGFGTAAPASAQAYPSHPIIMVVPLAPGGSTDVLGRIMAQAMGQKLGQPVVVENTAGAAGTIGVTRAERSAPDGYTILWGMWGTNVANGAIYNLGFDLLNDFEPIALVATQPFLIDARKTMPANNLKELVAWLKANADKATMGNSGVGSPSHVAGVLMENMVGTKWQMVSYRSAGLATQDLLAGTIDTLLDTPAVSLPHVKSGDLKSYAVTAKNRIAVAPDIPTTDEAGLPGYYFSFWHAMGAEGHAEGRHRQTQRSRHGGAGRSGNAQETHRAGAGDLSARPADARRAARVPEGRGREVVADHQGRRHQGGVIRRPLTCPSPPAISRGFLQASSPA
jgi:tripartite-type tricarboxylate transporter receptor subunit TctC